MTPINWATLGFAVLDVFNVLALFYFFFLNIFYLTSTIIAFRGLKNYVRRLKALDFKELLYNAGAPPITLLVPAYNEEATCIQSIRSLLLLEYPNYQIIVINDGSKDKTLTRLIEGYDLVPSQRPETASLKTAPVRAIYKSQRFPNLQVIDKMNGGKADALNAGLNYCQTPLFSSLDADSLLERDALIRVVRPFLENEKTVATGGIVRIVNGCEVTSGGISKVGLPKSLLAQFQVMEYLRAFMAGRIGMDEMGINLIISGAFGLFRRSAVIEIGGYATDTVGEDMELVVRLHAYYLERKIPYQIKYVADPVAWTECPESISVLANQRDRWQRGLYETMTRHRHMLGNPRYGRIGMAAFPLYFFLEMFGPLFEAVGYLLLVFTIIIGRASFLYLLTFFIVALVLGVVLSVSALVLEELTFRRYPNKKDLFRLFWLAVLENFGYRQLTAFWRFKGFISGVRHVKGWGKMERKGFAASQQPT